MKIQLLSNQQTQQIAAKSGKPYNRLELSFKNLGTGKIEGKNLMPFGETQATFNTLATANPGDVFEINVVKNQASGYWDWVGAERTTADAAPATSAQPAVGRTGGTANASPKSTYETPEERAVKQIYIVRQSSISSAIAILSPGNKSSLDVDQVLATASRLEDFVFGKDKQVDHSVEAAETLAGMENDVPF